MNAHLFKRNYILIAVLLLGGIFGLHAQNDTEFWFSFPKLADGYNKAIKLSFSTFDRETEVTISMPANPNFEPIKETIPAFSYRDINFTPAQLDETVTINYAVPDNKGLLIQSTNMVSCYYAQYDRDAEIYALKGRNALGREFLVPMQDKYPNRAADGISSIEIVATEDNTEVTVELPKGRWDIIDDYPAAVITANGGKITETLNRGENVTYRAKGKAGADHLGGVWVTSTKPVAVNSTDDLVKQGSYATDLIGDQLVPVEMTGTEYVAIKNNQDDETVYIWATRDNTRVTVNGADIGKTLDRGEQHSLVFGTDDVLHIEVTNDDDPLNPKNIVVFQVVQDSRLEFGGTMLPRIVCTGSMETVYRKTFANLTATIVVKTPYTRYFRSNTAGVSVSATAFQAVPSAPEWSWARIPINIAANEIFHLANDSAYFHLGTMDNDPETATGVTSYAYFSDYHYARPIPNTSKLVYGTNDTLDIFLENASGFTDIQWYKDGVPIPSDDGRLRIDPPLREADSGIYEVTANSIDGCQVADMTFYAVVNVLDAQRTDTAVCSDVVNVFRSRGEAPYTWSVDTVYTQGNEAGILLDEDTVLRVTNHRIASSVVVNGTFYKEDNYTATREFESDYTFNVPAGEGQFGLAATANIVSPDFGRIVDHTHGDATTGKHLIAMCSATPGQRIWSKELEDIRVDTEYELSAWFITAKRNADQAHLRFTVNGQPVGDTIVPPNDKTGTSAAHWQQFSCRWYSGTNTYATIGIETADGTPAGAGVCIDDIAFAPLLPVTDTIAATVEQSPEVHIEGRDMLCLGQSELHATSGWASYTWYNPDDAAATLGTDSLYTATEQGTYVVRVTEASQLACWGTDTITVRQGPTLTVEVNAAAEACSGEPEVSVSYFNASETLGSYNITWEADAQAAGFIDQWGLPVADGDLLSIPLPADVAPGTYRGQLEVFGTDECAASQRSPLEVTVKYNAEDLMAQKWNDVIALFNPDYNPDGLEYTAYQWYRNGQPLEGETRSYLYIADGTLDPADEYSVELTTTDGTVFRTCAFHPEARDLPAAVPTLVAPRQFIPLQEIALGGQASFYSPGGLLHSSATVGEGHGGIHAPADPGFYMLRVQAAGRQLQFKICVK